MLYCSTEMVQNEFTSNRIYYDPSFFTFLIFVVLSEVPKHFADVCVGTHNATVRYLAGENVSTVWPGMKSHLNTKTLNFKKHFDYILQ